MKILNVFAASLIVFSMGVSEAQAASRKVHFASLTQSHMRRDTAGTGKVHLVCLLSLKNISDTNSQSITDITMDVAVAMPTSAAIQPTYRTQSGNVVGTPAVPARRHYRFCSRSNCAVTASGTLPTSAAPVTLAPSDPGSVNNLDSLHFRSVAAFQYTGTNDAGGALQTNQSVMFQCTGSVTVRDTATTAAGAVIATGIAEAVANDYQQPGFSYGTTGFAYVAPVNPVDVMATRTDSQTGAAMRSEGSCASHVTPSYSCADALSWIQTGPGTIGTAGGHGTFIGAFAGFSHAPSPVGTSDDHRFGGGDVAWSGVGASVWDPAPQDGTGDWTNTVAPAPTAAYTGFPQHIMSVPFLVNGGRPF